MNQPFNPDELRPQEQDPKMTSMHSADVLGDEALRVHQVRVLSNHEDFDNRLRQSAANAFEAAVANQQSMYNQRASQDAKSFNNLHTQDDISSNMLALAGARSSQSSGVAQSNIDAGVSQAATSSVLNAATVNNAILQSLAALTKSVDALVIKIEAGVAS